MTATPHPRSYTFKEGLAMMAAKSVGIDPDLAVLAGEPAKAALNALRLALKAKPGPGRKAQLRAAQAELKNIDAAKYPKLVNAIQTKLLAAQGRGGDTAIAHLTPGEMVLPRHMLTPEIMQAITAAAAQRGLDMRQFIVGGGAASINPRTGAEEFFFKQIGDWVKQKLLNSDAVRPPTPQPPPMTNEWPTKFDSDLNKAEKYFDMVPWAEGAMETWTKERDPRFTATTENVCSSMNKDALAQSTINLMNIEREQDRTNAAIQEATARKSRTALDEDHSKIESELQTLRNKAEYLGTKFLEFSQEKEGLLRACGMKV